MLVSLFDSFLEKLASLWRSLGSPRIAGDEKLASAVKTAWTNRGRPAEKFSELSTTARNALIGASGIVAAAILIWIVMVTFGGDDGNAAEAAGFPTPTPFAGPEYLTEVQALSFALTAARDAGLVSQDSEHLARRIQFAEYAQAIGELDRANRGLHETPAGTEIWSFAFAGDVELELDNGERVDFDNLTIVLDALTGKIYRAEAFYGEYESEARAPVWLRPPTPTPVPPSG